MAKARTAYVCSECGAEYNKWQGQCGECGAWNTLVRDRAGIRRRGELAGRAPQRLGRQGRCAEGHRAEGRAPAARMRACPPASASSTACSAAAWSKARWCWSAAIRASASRRCCCRRWRRCRRRCPALYVTGEESLAQVAGRARAPGPAARWRCRRWPKPASRRILEHAVAAQPKLIVADSVQTLWTESLTAAPGSVSQVRESAARLVRYAKETGTAVFLVGHVTKEGGIAGPRVLEHMVDAVLYFEGESGSRFRVLRAFKNRFGAVNELGVFAMGEKGLKRSAESLGDLPVRRQHAAARQLRDGDARRHAAVAGGSAGAGRCLAAVESAPRRGRPGTEPAGDAARGAASPRRHRASATRTCSSTSSAASACRKPRPTCRCCSRCCRRCATSRWRRRPSPSAKSACRGEIRPDPQRRGAPEGSGHAWLQARDRAEGAMRRSRARSRAWK